MIEHMKKRGKIIFMLGVNDENTLHLSASAGCQAVLTDRVEWISKIVKEMKDSNSNKKKNV
jgi:glycerophosphoryl diester phosphodiesterase